MGNTGEEITERRLTRRDALKLAAAGTGLLAVSGGIAELLSPSRGRGHVGPAVEP